MEPNECTESPTTSEGPSPFLTELRGALASSTGLSVSDIAGRTADGSIAELAELNSFLQSCMADERLHAAATKLLVDYVPGAVVDGIKRLDPTYETRWERFRRYADRTAAARGRT